MSYTYANRKRGEGAAPQKEAAAPAPSLDALRAGTANPTAEQMGHRVDLPDAMRAKMENAFGADLSAVKLYESEAVADAGANAVAQGADIAFAPGMLDFTSYGGQALLGHEISHVVSQARGEVTGGGFLNDSVLEARADREGAMAAAGQQVSMPTAALSPVSAASAAGPMQASKEDKYRRKEAEAYDNYIIDSASGNAAKYLRDYEKFRGKKAVEMRKHSASEEDIAADNAQITDPLQMIQRARARNITPDAGLRNHKRHMDELNRILSHMPDDALRKSVTNPKDRPDVRNAMLDDYIAAYHAGMGDKSSSAFHEVDSFGGDLMANMYRRMMGTRDVGAMLGNESQNVALGLIEGRAQESGVTDLLRRQHHGVYRSDPKDASISNVLRESETMRSFWSKAVFPSMAQGGSRAIINATQMGEKIRGTSKDVIQNQYNDMLLDGIHGNELSDGTAAQFLLHLTETKSTLRDFLDRKTGRRTTP